MRGEVTPAKLSTMLELSQRVAWEPGTVAEKKGEGGRVTIGRACKQYSFPGGERDRERLC